MAKVADWTPIERDYRNTKTTIATLARTYGISPQTVKNHMQQYGIVRNPPSALPTPITEPARAVKAVTKDEMRAMRNAVIDRHQAHIDVNLKRLEMICDRLDAMTGLSNMQRLNALKEVAKISEIYIKLERQAHNIVEETPAPVPQAPIQVNININPQSAYLEMIGKK
jgi:transposase-like protein